MLHMSCPEVLHSDTADDDAEGVDADDADGHGLAEQKKPSSSSSASILKGEEAKEQDQGEEAEEDEERACLVPAPQGEHPVHMPAIYAHRSDF